MGEWLSSCVKEQPEVREALSDLSDNIREYEDAAKPSACRETGGGFWSPELTLFRPGWKLFTIISVVYGIGGFIFSLFMPNFEASAWADLLSKWTDLALRITVPVFVLGISLVALSRSISESGRFAGEYLNDSCRAPWFCCLTLVAVLCGLVGHFVSTIEDIPNVVIVGICMASVGAAINCLAMLAFVILETMRCSVPSEAIKVVSRYAARKLTYGYVNDSYITLFHGQQKDYLEKWCAEKTIYPPARYYGHYLKSSLYSGSGENDVEIELVGNISGQDVYKDYDLKGLAKLGKYLKRNNAKLYLSSPLYESERNVLGILSGKNVKQNERLQSVVSRKGRKAIRWQKYKFLEKDEDFWDSQESKLNEAVKRAVDKADPIQVKAYLEAVNVPLSVLRQVRRKHKVIRDAYGEYVEKGYQFLMLYLRALREILARKENDHVYSMARVVRKSVWEETKNILRDMDYHTMELYTWLVQKMYAVIKDAGDKAENLQEMRGQFGGFYEFAGGWLEDSESKNVEDVNKMRLVLHKGLTKWLLAAIEKKDGELIEQLCDAGRRIVFGREGIKFHHREVVVQYFVLAGQLISLAKTTKVDATAVEKLFCECYSHDPDVNFDELVRFYRDNSLPLKELDSYLRIFYSPTEVHKNLFTGSSSSSGYGMTGGREMSLAFIFLAAHALASIHPLPSPIAGMSGKITNGNIKTIREVFKNHFLNHGLDQLEKWIQTCEELHEAKEDKEIAEAKIDEAKVKEHERKFWEGYSRAIPVLSMCLKNGSYEIDNNVKNEWRYNLPKIALFDWKYPISGAEGDRYGLDIGRKMEKNILNAIIKGGDAESEVKNAAEAVGEAVKWLEKEGCANDKGIIILAGERSPEIEMHKDKDFIPSWREEVKSMGFNGFYRGFPISWLREGDEDEGEENGAKEKKPQYQKVVAVVLRGWIGLKVRKEVVVDQRFGELKIRTWTEEEISQAIESGKLDAKDADKAKGNCPVDVTFFWEFVKGKSPRTKAFKFGNL